MHLKKKAIADDFAMALIFVCRKFFVLIVS